MPRPRFKAVALRYEAGLPAPFLLAKGAGREGERLARIAEEKGVPLLRDEALAEALYPIDIGGFVPVEYYEIVAKVFAFVKSIEEA